MFTVGQAFPDKTGYRPQTFYNAINSGMGELAKLPYYRIGRSIRIAEEDLDAFLERRRVEPARGA